VRRENPRETHGAFYLALVSLPVGMPEQELSHSPQHQGTWLQALFQLDGRSQLQQKPQALQAQQTAPAAGVTLREYGSIRHQWKTASTWLCW